MLDTRSSTEPAGEEQRAAPRAYQAWRPVDEMVLRALLHARTDPVEIARRLGRTPREIEPHLKRLGAA